MPTTTATRARRATAPTNVSFLEDFAAFKRTYKAAQAAVGASVNPLQSFASEPVLAPIINTTTDGYVGFKFGIELEFNSGPSGYFDDSSFCSWMNEQRYMSARQRMGYHSGADTTNVWRFEDDCSVTGGEVISPILSDNIESWTALSNVVKKIVELGGTADTRSAGAHIHIDTSDMGDDLDTWKRFFTLGYAFEDVLYRLAANPFRTGAFQARHRGNGYCAPLSSSRSESILNFTSLGDLLYAHSSHNYMMNSANVRRTGVGHVEIRLWDATLDMSTIQTHVKICAALRAAAMNPDLHDRIMALDWVPQGTHRARRLEWSREEGSAMTNSLSRLSGEQWREDTKNFREFCDILFPLTSDKEQMTTLFAMNRKWMRSR